MYSISSLSSLSCNPHILIAVTLSNVFVLCMVLYALDALPFVHIQQR